MLKNFHTKFLFWKISTKLCFVRKLSQKIALLKISRKKCSIGKFPQNYALLDNFHKKMQCLKITTKKLPTSTTLLPTPWKCPNSSWQKFLEKFLKSFGFSLNPPPLFGQTTNLRYFKKHLTDAYLKESFQSSICN